MNCLNLVIQDFTEWLKEVNNIDDKALRKYANSLTNEEIVDMIINDESKFNEIQCYLSLQRYKEINRILELRNFVH